MRPQLSVATREDINTIKKYRYENNEISFSCETNELITMEQSSTTKVYVYKMGLEILSTCKTHPTKDYALISGVYTMKHNRMRGYMKEMILELIYCLNNHDNVKTIILYSSISVELYKNMNFKPIISECGYRDVIKMESKDLTHHDYTSLYFNDVEQLYTLYHRYLSDMSSFDNSICLDTSVSRMLYWIKNDLILRANKMDDIKVGAKINSSFVLWMTQNYKNELTCVVMDAKDINDYRILLNILEVEAIKYNKSKITICNPRSSSRIIDLKHWDIQNNDRYILMTMNLDNSKQHYSDRLTEP